MSFENWTIDELFARCTDYDDGSLSMDKEEFSALRRMLQCAVQPQNQQQNIPENIPATQFKPVADLYGLTSPTGGETSFTFDAVEARDFIDGGWSCQEYVELGRFQEAMLQNGNSPAHSGCRPAQNCISPAQCGNSPEIPDGWVMLPAEPTQAMMNAWLSEVANWRGHAAGYRAMIAAAPHQGADGNSPVIPDCWVACSERMPEQFKAILAFNEYGEVWSGAYDRYWNFYCDNLLVEHVTHWMPLPAAPQQEVTQALAKGMERYGDAMQKLADSGD